MNIQAKTIDEYLAKIPEDRRETIRVLRNVIRKNLSKGYKEELQYGHIGYVVPHSVYPPGYHCDPKQPLPFGGLASQKNHIGIYLMCVYSDPEHDKWFRNAWKKSGKKLDMGKGCIRIKKLEDVPLDVLGEAIRRVPAEKFVAHYEEGRSGMKSQKPKTAKKATAKKGTSARVVKKKTASAKKVKAKPAVASKVKKTASSSVKKKARKSAKKRAVARA